MVRIMVVLFELSIDDIEPSPVDPTSGHTQSEPALNPPYRSKLANGRMPSMRSR